MSRSLRSFRPTLECLEGRLLLSAPPSLTPPLNELASTIMRDLNPPTTPPPDGTLAARVAKDATGAAALKEPAWGGLMVDLLGLWANDRTSPSEAVTREGQDFAALMLAPQDQFAAFASNLAYDLTGTTPAGPAAPAAPPAGQDPQAVDDTQNNNALYIAYASAGGSTPSVLDVAADAGVQVNDVPFHSGDLLLSGSATANTTPALGSYATIATTLGGVAILGADGSFSYTPPAGVSNVQDSFTYKDWEVDTSGNLIGVSNVATVQIDVMAPEAVNIVPGVALGGLALDGGQGWSKYHQNTGNTGIGTVARAPAFAPAWTTTLPSSVEGSPVLGTAAGGTATVFIEDTNNLVALSQTSGATLWTSQATTGPVKSAPAVILGAGTSPDYLVMGDNNGNLLSISSSTGDTAATFTAQESYGGVSDNTGPITSSPTVVSFLAPGSPVITNALVFGVNAGQGYGTSDGRLYAVRSGGGGVAWEALLAGAINGSPLVVPPSTLDKDGSVWVETVHNNWGGNPGTPGGEYGRVYKLDAITGQVQAELFVEGDMVGSPALLPGGSGSPDPNGTNAQIFVTSAYGFVADVTPVLAAPATGMETPTPTVNWKTQVGLDPTSVTTSRDGTAVYVGDNTGMNALSVATGASNWDVTRAPNGDSVDPVVGAPIAVPQAGAGATSSQVIWGSDGSPGHVLAYLDSGSSATFNAEFGTQLQGFGFAASSMAEAGAGAPNPGRLFIGSTDGSVIALD